MITEKRIKLNKADLFKSALEITQAFSEMLKMWREEEPRKDRGEKLFYCHVCSYVSAKTYYHLKRYGKPKCPTCGVEMAEFDAQRWKELRQRLADEALQATPRAVEALLKAAEVHGFLDGAEAVVEYGHVLRIVPDHTPNELRYDASTRRLEAFYYYYDLPQHVESLKALIKAAWQLGLGVLLRIYPNHKTMPLPYDNLPIGRDMYGHIEIKMTAEELRGFARGYGGL